MFELSESGRTPQYSWIQDVEDKYILSIANHQEISAALKAFCQEREIFAGEVRGLGAVRSATLRFLDPATKQYVDKTFEEQMEITNLTGNISMKDGEVYLHLHITLGRRDYTVIGGHLLTAEVNGACELFVEDYINAAPGRRFDAETGLNLYDF